MQLGCLLVLAYIEIPYIREIVKKKIHCDPIYTVLLAIAPWCVFFDGLTAWMVNRQSLVSPFWNRAAHLMFLLLLDQIVVLTAAYMYNQLVGFRQSGLKKTLLFAIPGLASVLMIFGGIGSLRYLAGKTTSYSMGFSVYVCFATVLIYYGFILYLLISRYRLLPKEKVWGILSFIGIVGLILLFQLLYPEVLLTSLCVTILMLGIYIDFENPSFRKLSLYNREMVDGFATMVESRDNNTGGHIKRTRAYVDLILRKMQDDARYRKMMNRDYMTNVSNAAPLHDIGKIATPDRILQKPGKLTAEEFAIIQEHAAKGGDIILTAFRDLDDGEFRKIAYEVARHHHEKYNGKGYPDGLAGEEIPLHARIMAIADVFDAVSQKRCYRDAMSLDESMAIIEKGIGTDFDPDLARIFLDAKEEVAALMGQGLNC